MPDTTSITPTSKAPWHRLAIPMILLLSATASQALRKGPLDPADTSSPRATLNSFIDGCNDIYARVRNEKEAGLKTARKSHRNNARRIFRCLDLSTEAGFLVEHTAGIAAVSLKETLDRIEIPPLDQIPGKEELEAAIVAGEPIKKWTIPHTEITIVLITEGPRAGDYLFNADTVDRAHQFYKNVQHLPYRAGSTELFYHWFLSTPGPRVAPVVNALPDSLRTKFWGDHAIWQWIGLAIGLSIAFAVMAFVYWFGRKRSQALRESDNLFLYCLSLAFPIAAMLIPLWVGSVVRDELRLSGTALAIVMISTSIIFLFGAMHVIVAAGSRIAELIISSPKIHPKGLDAQLVRIICRVLSITASTIVFLEGGKHLGIPISTLLAGAGVGGLALALAAQDSLKNFFGSMMIILDKPYRVGERVVVKGYDGFVEEIGLRSTKLRLLNGHQATIPNEECARSDIENIGRRPHIRRKSNLRLPLDTTPEQAGRAVEIVRNILADHDGMAPDRPPRIYLDEINDDSLNLLMCYWFHPPDYDEFLAHSQEVNLRIGREFAAEGLHFAPPTMVAHLGDGSEQSEADMPPPAE